MISLTFLNAWHLPHNLCVFFSRVTHVHSYIYFLTKHSALHFTEA